MTQVLGLQNLRKHQLHNMQYCLPHYRFYGGMKEDHAKEDGLSSQKGSHLFPTVAVLKSAFVEVEYSGRFRLSDSPPALLLQNDTRTRRDGEPFQPSISETNNIDDQTEASWVQLRIKDHRNRNTEAFSNKQSNTNPDDKLLTFSTIQFPVSASPVPGRSTNSKYAPTFSRKAAIRTRLLGKKLEKLFGNIIQKQPTVMTGDFGWETNSPCYNIMKTFSYRNTMEKSRYIFTDYSSPRKTLTDYIWHTGSNIESVMSAVMIEGRPDGGPLANNRPVLGVLRL